MNLFSYIKSLTHRFSKNEVQKSCDLVTDSLNAHTIPAYVGASTMFKNFKIKSKKGVGFESDFKRLVRGRDGMIDTILAMLENSVKTLEAISKKSETLYGDQESSLGLTFQKATYLQLVGALTFTNDFSRKFLNYLYALETAEMDRESKVEDTTTPAENAFVEEQFANYCTCVRIFSDSFDQIEKSVDALPDAVVSEHTESNLTSSLGEKKIDPLGLRNFHTKETSVKFNPFYLIGMWRAEMQIERYKTAKEELDLLQLRKLNLERMQEKKPDARLQKEIEYLSTRVSGLNYKIQKVEAKYA